MTLAEPVATSTLRILVMLVLGIVAAGIVNVAAAQGTARAWCGTLSAAVSPGTIRRVTPDAQCRDEGRCVAVTPCPGDFSDLPHPSGRCEPADCQPGPQSPANATGTGNHAANPSRTTRYVWIQAYEHYGRTYLGLRM